MEILLQPLEEFAQLTGYVLQQVGTDLIGRDRGNNDESRHTKMNLTRFRSGGFVQRIEKSITVIQALSRSVNMNVKL